VNPLAFLAQVARDGWEWDMRYAQGQYSVSLWRSEWTTNNPYGSVALPTGHGATPQAALLAALAGRLELTGWWIRARVELEDA